MSEGHARPERIEIVCLGAAMVDLLGLQPRQTLDDVDTFKRTLSCAPINVATTAARLGRKAAVLARVGDDAFGRYIRGELGRRGIADNWLQIDAEEATTVAFFAQTATTRNFLVVRGADRLLELGDDDRALLESAAALHVTTFALSLEPGRSAAVEAIELAHSAGRIISLDPNFRAGTWRSANTFMPLLRRLLPLTTVIKPSLKDAEAIWGPGQSPGDYIERFHAHGARQVLLTLGREGVIASDGATVQRLPAVPVESSDTVGVGDAFTAGAITALIDGTNLLTAARVGMLVASYKLRSPNYSGPLPRWAALLEQANAGGDPEEPELSSFTTYKR